jgi:hypothetical protein
MFGIVRLAGGPEAPQPEAPQPYALVGELAGEPKALEESGKTELM